MQSWMAYLLSVCNPRAPQKASRWDGQSRDTPERTVGLGGMTSVLGKLSAKSNEETRERLWQALGEPQGSGPKGKMPASIWCSELTKCVSQ